MQPTSAWLATLGRSLLWAQARKGAPGPSLDPGPSMASQASEESPEAGANKTMAREPGDTEKCCRDDEERA